VAKRTTNVGTQVEYVPAHKIRTTDIGTNVEYVLVHKIRTTNIGAQVEYIPIHRARITNVGIMVEYQLWFPTGKMVTQIRGSNQIISNTIQKHNIDTETENECLVTNLVAGEGVTISETGTDIGTGEVTISASESSQRSWFLL